MKQKSTAKKRDQAIRLNQTMEISLGTRCIKSKKVYKRRNKHVGISAWGD